MERSFGTNRPSDSHLQLPRERPVQRQQLNADNLLNAKVVPALLASPWHIPGGQTVPGKNSFEKSVSMEGVLVAAPGVLQILNDCRLCHLSQGGLTGL